MAEPATRRWTLADLETLDDQDGWIKYEIIDGELFELHAASNEHNETGSLTCSELVVWNRSSGLGSVIIAPGLIYSDDNNCIPDVIWVSHARRTEWERADGKLHGSPELVVEIMSPGTENARRDREIKRGLYARRGVDEYWILDPATRTVSVYRHTGSDLPLVATLGPADTLTSPVLPGFAVIVARLFPPAAGK